MKYIHINDKGRDKHWEQCEKAHTPFIEISEVGNGYVNIFYDITNHKIDLEQLSNDIRCFYRSYVEFLMVDPPRHNELYDQYYFFNFIVKKEHSDFIASSLFDYIYGKLKLTT